MQQKQPWQKHRSAERSSLPKVLLPRTKRQQHQLLSQQQVSNEVEDSDDSGYDEVDLHVPYRRPEVVTETYNIDSDDDDLPTHITERLAQIRALALEKYRETRV